MELENEVVESKEVDETKREFMKKFGKYAATAPLGMYLLMSPSASHAQASGSSCHIDGCHWVCVKIKGKPESVFYRVRGNSQAIQIEANKAYPYFVKNKVWEIVATPKDQGHKILKIVNPRGKEKDYAKLPQWKQNVIDTILDNIGC